MRKALAGILGILAALFGTSASAQVAQGIKAYARGEYTTAMRAFEAGAAKGGHYKAGNELGILYIEGRGVPRDPIEGMAWIYPATHASIMDSSAMANAIQAAGLLDRAQIQEAQARGQTYFRRYIAPNRAVVRALSGG
ncbi:hypothetical protein E8E01_14470 [Methylorubrum populi]|uniref:hypothetical protein n=1 Tax=Methylorubrum TaxID=2282523 RepID=UPI001152BD08|nr:hypothetical protein [Methylorubrum populi]QDI81565.1 hypothetical protein E8E01_14470 [Methylorubrum populi]